MESNHPNTYYLLTNSVQRSLDSLIEMNAYYRRLNHFSIFLDIVALVALAYASRIISINPYSFLLYMMISAFLSYVGIFMIKKPKEK
ncbi:hypothetical protein ACPWSR_03840 [Alloiococcus sp. CFN-8]|uniref:hypothetical protein n=1 Tax=Alloiococcus sp. CFN-8 TaxID=3416081 RepID=UPI003CE9FF0B